jgi:hypothetical protein
VVLVKTLIGEVITGSAKGGFRYVLPAREARGRKLPVSPFFGNSASALDGYTSQQAAY